MTTCPACGSENVSSHPDERSVRMPFGPRITYEAKTHTCEACGCDGDFDGASSPIIMAAVRASELASIEPMLEILDKHGMSKTYLERVLRLPFGTLRGWANGENVTPEGMALLRFLAEFPELAGAAPYLDGGPR